MLTKLDFTQQLIAKLPDPPALNHAMETWWYDHRQAGGLRLSSQGVKALESLGVEHYEFELPRSLLPRHLLSLGRKMSCPYYINNRGSKPHIIFYGGREASMYALFGDIDRFCQALNPPKIP